MLAVVQSLSLCGMESIPIGVEVTVTRGLPQFIVIGLPDKAVQEARERVLATLVEAGYCLPLKKIVVNLAPADLKKDGCKFDLPIAIGILQSLELAAPAAAETLVLGELSISGELRPVRGLLAMLLGAVRRGYRRFIIPATNENEARMVPGILIGSAANLQEALELHDGSRAFLVSDRYHVRQSPNPSPAAAFGPILGQEAAKRAALIAAAGRHHIMLYGPPGIGKTMLARCLPALLPPMDEDEMLETTALYSLYGWNEKGECLVGERPFRSPHHSSSDVSIIGGGSWPRPGEISLAHNGVLFLDELQEFRSVLLNMLRQPLQDQRVVLSRSAGSVVYPARFLLICALNPCPCGHLTDDTQRCICSPQQVRRYFSRISGPLLDRIDLQVEMPRQKPLVHSGIPGAASQDLPMMLERARSMQRRRLRTLGLRYNSEIPGETLENHLPLNDSLRLALRSYTERYHPSNRAIVSLLRITRTIADLEGEGKAREEHLLEAMRYRMLENHIYNSGRFAA